MCYFLGVFTHPPLDLFFSLQIWHSQSGILAFQNLQTDFQLSALSTHPSTVPNMRHSTLCYSLVEAKPSVHPRKGLEHTVSVQNSLIGLICLNCLNCLQKDKQAVIPPGSFSTRHKKSVPSSQVRHHIACN